MTDLPPDYFNRSIAEIDPEIADAIGLELQRQQRTLEMIASENFVPQAILEAQGSVLTNKYAEGYPGRRYYGGCEHVDVIEQLAIDRAKELFGAEHANVQPHAGAQTNACVYHALLQPGDTIMGLALPHGGHLSHGMKLNMSGRLYDIAPYEVSPETGLIDMDEVQRLAQERKPKLIIAGWSAYPRQLDFPRFREIADEVGAILLVDMAHFAGLVAGGVHPNPVPYADVVTTTVHKTLGGARGGLILCKQEHQKKIDSAVFPGQQGGPLEHVIAGKAIAFKIAMSETFRERQRRTVAGAQAVAGELLRDVGDRARRQRADRRDRRAPGARRPAGERARRSDVRGPAARDRDHGQPQRGPVRPAAADDHERSACRCVGARHPRPAGRRLRGGRGGHRDRADAGVRGPQDGTRRACERHRGPVPALRAPQRARHRLKTPVSSGSSAAGRAGGPSSLGGVR